VSQLTDLGLYNSSVYNKLERPVVNESDTLVVSFSLVLQQIIGVVRDQSINQLINQSVMYFRVVKVIKTL